MDLPTDATRQKAWGVLLGLFSAVGYTAANIFLRAAADVDPVWVSFIKSLPTVVIFTPWVLWQLRQSHPMFPDRKAIGVLILAALIGHLAGNVVFQWSLGVIGIALAVPLTLGTIILGGTFWGTVGLKEPLSLTMAVAMGVLIGAIAILSLGAEDASISIRGPSQPLNPWEIASGVLAACVAGFAYSVLGASIRLAARRSVPVSTTLLIVSVTGMVGLGVVCAWQSERVTWDVTELEGMSMFLAGLSNAIAFLALTKSLQLIQLIYVNALNATQATMAAIAGAVIFGEAVTTSLVLGVVLTVVGLMLMRPQRSGRKTPRSDAVGSQTRAPDPLSDAMDAGLGEPDGAGHVR